MALKTFKPYTKSTRGTILVDRTGLWKGKPFKSLVSPKNAMKGRNNNGHITSINRSGGHKKMYRHVDFYRKKFDVEATVERIEYDPNRSCYIMLVKFEDGSHASFAAAAVNPEATLSDGANVAWNVLTSPVAKVTLGGNRNLSAGSGGITGQFISLLVIQDGTGSRTLTFNAVYEFTGDEAPTLTTTASKGDLFVFRYN